MSWVLLLCRSRLSTPALQENITDACTTMSDFICTRDAFSKNNKTRNLSVVNTYGPGGGGKRKAGDAGNKALDERAQKECKHLTNYYYEKDEFESSMALNVES